MSNGPTVIIVGAPRSGTTSLFRALSSHPDVCPSKAKEPYHFHVAGERPTPQQLSDKFGRSMPFGALEWEKAVRAVAPNDAALYEKLWEPGTPHRVEATPCYLFDRLVAERIYKAYPDVRIVALLRHPVLRAVSHWDFYRRGGKEPIKDAGEAFKEEPVNVDEFWWGIRHYLRHSMYGRQLARYFALFPASHIKVLIYEEFFATFRKSLVELWEWLGLSEPVLSRYGAWRSPREIAVDEAVFAKWSRFFEDDVAQVEGMLGRTVGAWH